MLGQIPVLLDTDLGSDIDDAVALAYLVRQPRCELVGITTVSGDVQKRAAIGEVICRAAGRDDVPIHCGRREPLAYGQGQPNVPQYDRIQDQTHRLDRPENTAVDFMRDTIRSRPGEIVLLSIGPYSNLALLFGVDPEIPFLLKGLVSMGGVFFRDGAEWNAICDPVATSIVFGTKRHDHISLGLDVTLKCVMSAEEVRRRFLGEPLATVAHLAEAWFTDTPRLVFHDPLAAACIFNSDLCGFRHGQVSCPPVEDPKKWGTTPFVEGDGPDRVAETVDVGGFFEEYFSVFR